MGSGFCTKPVHRVKGLPARFGHTGFTIGFGPFLDPVYAKKCQNPNNAPQTHIGIWPIWVDRPKICVTMKSYDNKIFIMTQKHDIFTITGRFVTHFWTRFWEVVYDPNWLQVHAAYFLNFLINSGKSPLRRGLGPRSEVPPSIEGSGARFTINLYYRRASRAARSY